MQTDRLKVVDGAAAGSWIAPMLEGDFGAVSLQVTNDFEAYVRVFHPALDDERNPVAWADVAKTCGTTPHREMQWHAILGLANADALRGSYGFDETYGVRWAGYDPPTGALDIDTLDALCHVLAGHTADPDHCFFGLCTIQNWMDQFSTTELQPLLQLPDGRDHIVLAGPISAVDEIEYDWSVSTSSIALSTQMSGSHPPSSDLPAHLQRHAPNLIWPDDHSWLVVTEVDFDSTLIGGNAALVEAIVQSSHLEAWQVAPDDSLAADADTINIVSND